MKSFLNTAVRLAVSGSMLGGVMAAGPSAAVAVARQPETTTEVFIDALADALAEADALRARLEALEFGRRGGAWTPDGTVGLLDAGTLEALRVLDVNHDLRMVILSAGHRDGLRPGMRFALMRDGDVTVQVRVLDVRGAVSGALMETAPKRRMPSTSDRPVLMRGQP